jgi:AsmA protein
MGKLPRVLLIAVGAVVALFLLVAICLPLFLNADSFRTKIEATLTKSLGRKVTIGKLELSVWSGGLVATNTSVADDPAFSSQPFIEAESVKIGVELLPLVFSKELRIRGFSLVSPKVQLLRAANGTWNYSSIGKSGAASTQDTDTKQAFPDLTVGHVTVQNGRFAVGAQPAAGAAGSAPLRVYDQVNLEVKDFGFKNSFPFTVSAHLPGDGTVSLTGKAGPVNAQDASATPFSGDLEMKHIDPLAAGFVDASDGITGVVDDLVLDASWDGTQMHVKKLVVDTPRLTVVRNNTPPAPKPAEANAEGASMMQNLSVDSAQIKNGTITLTTAGQKTPPAVYQQLNAQISNLSPKTSSPFTVSAQLPGGGSLNANGNMGPINQQNSAATPLNAQVTLKHVELASSGVLPPDAGIGGTMDLQAQIQSNGQTLNATGNSQIAGIKLAANGQPAAKPVQVQFAVSQDEQAMTGQVQHAAVTLGRAVINISGTYQTSGPTTALNLKVNGDSMPVDELEAFLPAAGVHLPQGSALKGGTLTTALTVSGSTESPVISGPVKLSNTQLAGFDLGSKLQTLSKLTGGKIGGATGSGTNIRSLSMNIRESGGAIQTDNIALDVADVGTATGAGSVSAAGALNYNMNLKLTGLVAGAGGGAPAASAAGGKGALLGSLAGALGGGAAGGLGGFGGLAGAALKNGIPVAIGGTTSNPTFAPNLAGVLSGVGGSAAQGLVSGKTGGKQSGTQSTPLGNALGGLLNHR